MYDTRGKLDDKYAPYVETIDKEKSKLLTALVRLKTGYTPKRALSNLFRFHISEPYNV